MPADLHLLFHTTPHLRVATSVLFACIISFAAHAEVYKWTDEDGRIHYGDRPQGNDSETIEVKPAPEPDAGIEERREKQRRLLEVIDEERKEDEQEQAEANKEKQERQINCEKAKKYNESLRTAGGLYHKGDNGNKVVLTDEERTTAETQARENLEYWCD